MFAEATKDVEWLSANGMHLLDLSALAHMFDLSALQATVMPLIWDCYASTDRIHEKPQILCKVLADILPGCPARKLLLRVGSIAMHHSDRHACFRFTHALDFAPGGKAVLAHFNALAEKGDAKEAELSKGGKYGKRAWLNMHVPDWVYRTPFEIAAGEA